MVALEQDRAPGRSPLSLRLLRELHEKLMRGVRGDAATPGQFRRSQNWIGPAGCTLAGARFVPPPPDRLLDCLGAWEKFLHEQTLPPLVHIALAHSQFEAIHPFLDGNGRVGRCSSRCCSSTAGAAPPLLYLSAFFEATRQEYYARLSGVTERGEWEEWLAYFCAASRDRRRTRSIARSASTRSSRAGASGSRRRPRACLSARWSGSSRTRSGR